MPQIGPNYTGETPTQIAARETFNAQILNDVQLRNLISASIAEQATVPALITANLATAKTAKYVVEISPSTIIDTAGTAHNTHK